MWSIPIIVGVVVTAAGGTALAAGLGMFDDLAGDRKECAWHLEVPMTGRPTAALNLTFNNSVAPIDVRVCAFDADGFERVDESFVVPVSPKESFELNVPPGRYLLNVEFHGPGDEQGWVETFIDPSICPDGRHEQRITIARSGGGTWYTRPPALCTADGADANASAAMSGTGPLSGKPGIAIGSALSAAGLAVIALAKAETLAVGAAAFFSRLVHPKLLDQPTRAAIHALVSERPGVTFRDVVRTLGLGQGQGQHHLRVMVRERVLCRQGGFYFVAGRYSRHEMKAMAALQCRTARALFEALPPAPAERRVVDLARTLGVSPSWTAKVSRRLEAAGLVVRRRQGRTCLVGIPGANEATSPKGAASAPPLVPAG